MSLFLICLLACTSSSGGDPEDETLNVEDEIQYCLDKIAISLENSQRYDMLPASIPAGEYHWETKKAGRWTSGFWPGILWYAYEYSNDPSLKKEAEKFTRALEPVLHRPVKSHDLGFIFYSSYGNAYRITGNERYRETLLVAADSLTHLFNPKAGTILSWPAKVRDKIYYPHNTIIDNMLNLELLFWAAKATGDSTYFNMAETHALTTMKNHIRSDSTTWHVIVYDSTGGVKEKVTHQGYADNSLWARGQAWGIYGFTLCYRETGNPAFLQTARSLAAAYLKRLPADRIPYWDFEDPAIPEASRDASAAAITASALLELSTLVDNTSLQQQYRQSAREILQSLSSEAYKSNQQNAAFLMHSTGSKPGNYEIDVPIIYADYYYLEALLRLKKLAHKY